MEEGGVMNMTPSSSFGGPCPVLGAFDTHLSEWH